MADSLFLEKYGGESLDELLEMEATHRVDSLVLAIEAALDQKATALGLEALSREERVVLAVEALEREVNNGGYEQFFLNSSRVYVAEVESALRAIGCPGHAEVARGAVAQLELTSLDEESIRRALKRGRDELRERLSPFDVAYQEQAEDIAGRLFSFINAHRSTITLLGAHNTSASASAGGASRPGPVALERTRTFTLITRGFDLSQERADSAERALRQHVSRIRLVDRQGLPAQELEWLRSVADGEIAVTLGEVMGCSAVWLWIEGATHRPALSTYIIRTDLDD